MELLFESTDKFEHDMAQLAPGAKEQVVAQLNQVSASLLNGRGAFLASAYKPYLFNLGKLDSSLYVMRISEAQHAVVAVDDDPLFDNVTLTLFRLVAGQEAADAAYKSVGNELYREQGLLHE